MQTRTLGPKMTDQENKCSECKKNTFSVYIIDEKEYCLSCIKELPQTCSDCKTERKKRDFPDCQDHCWTCEFKRVDDYEKVVEPNIMSIFEKFQNANPRYKSSKIPSEEEFKVLKAELKSNLNSGFWAKKFIGFGDSPPLFFTDQQAKELWSLVENLETGLYKFIHAMGPSLLLAYKMREVHSVWRYYPAKTEESIMNQWKNKWEWLYNCDSFVADQCGVCLGDISSNEPWAICGNCQNNTHISCKLKHLKVKEPDYTCEHCRFEYKDDEDIVFKDYRSHRQVSKHSFKLLSWRDYLAKY